MIFTKNRLVSIVLLALFLPLTVNAQDYSLSATYGSFDLYNGFTPDPKTVTVRSGGSINAKKLGGDCVGFVANAPDVQFTYDAGTFSLWVSVISSNDTTLVINKPDGSWVCDDDSGGDLDPSIYFSNATSGVYDVWIGTYGSNDVKEATLYLSELGQYGN